MAEGLIFFSLGANIDYIQKLTVFGRILQFGQSKTKRAGLCNYFERHELITKRIRK